MQNDAFIPPPWYRQFWPWFLIALPGSVVVAGFATLFIAMHDPDGLVAEDYYKEGLAINQTLEQVHTAQQAGITALARFEPETARLHIHLNGAQEPTLTLTLAHPTRAHLDRSLVLRADSDGNYVQDVADLPPGNWHITLEPADERWRISSRMALPERSQTLLSAQGNQPAP